MSKNSLALDALSGQAITLRRCDDCQCFTCVCHKSPKKIYPIGTIKYGFQIGKENSYKYSWQICQVCLIARWVRHRDYQRGMGLNCRSCQASLNNRNGQEKRKSRIRHLIALG